MRPMRIRIVGGSLAGLFAGILLARDGHDVKIYERSSSGFAGRGAGLVPQSEVFHILREIGVEHLATFGVVSRDRIWFDRSGAIARRAHMPQTQISWDLLYKTLAERLDPGIYVLGKPVTAVREEAGGSLLEFDDGSVESADLVIGADGVSSAVRTTINTDAVSKYAGYVAWRGLVPEDDLPQAARTLIGNFAFYVVPGNHVLGYLVPGAGGEISEGNRRYNWVWYRFVAQRELPKLFTGMSGRTYLFSLPKGELSREDRARLRADADDMLPKPFALAVAAEANPSIQAIWDYESQRMVGSAVALIGDAAFVARPHTAMGVAKAAADVLALRLQLQRHSDLQQALKQYEKERIVIGRSTVAYGRQLGASAL